MAKTNQYVNKYGARFKNWVCLREKEAYNNKWNNIYFDTMFFEVRGLIFFFAGDNFEGTFTYFRFMMCGKVLTKELARILSHVHKIFNRRVSFKMLLPMCLVVVEKKL